MGAQIWYSHFCNAAMTRKLFQADRKFVYAQIVPWLSYSVPGVLNLGFLTIDTGIALYCFLLCVSMDPGRCAFCLMVPLSQSSI